MKKPAPDRDTQPDDNSEPSPDDESDIFGDTDSAFADADPSGVSGMDDPTGAADAPPAGRPAGDSVLRSLFGAGAGSGAEQEIAALAKEVGVQKDKYLRLYADYENFKKRSVRERHEAESRGMGLLIKGILDTLDDLGRFAHLDPASTDAKTVVDGVELVERKLLKSLAGHGLEVVNPVGEPFDPAFQEAITTAPAESKADDNLVALVYQVGYVFNGQLLRPARVVVKQWQGGGDAGEPS